MTLKRKPIGDYGGEEVTVRHSEFYNIRTYYHHAACPNKGCWNGAVVRHDAIGDGSYRVQCEVCRTLCFPREEHRQTRRELAKRAKDRALEVEAKLKALTGIPASRWPKEKLGRFKIHADPNELVLEKGLLPEALRLAAEWRQAFEDYQAW